MPERASPNIGRRTAEVDVAIVGGGIAGLWLANLLGRRGYGCVLLEADALGAAQTLASQGLIHGGLKYALAGSLTGASEAIAGMPARWRACLDGRGEVDLSAVRPLADRYCLFAAESTLGRLTAFFASRALRGRIERLEPRDYPPALKDPGFRGVVYALDDFVLDARQLVTALARGAAGRLYRHRLEPGAAAHAADGVLLDLGGERLLARRLVLAAGAGNEPLLAGLDLDVPMQRRPLQQVLVRHRYPHPLFGHCLTGIRRPEPRLTITSHRTGEDWLWYLGGQLATDGAALAPEALVRHARAELDACLPWIDWRDAAISTFTVDRAEPAQRGGRRPDQAFVEARGNCLVCWPTKLSLVPDLGDRVLALLPPPSAAEPPPLALPAPEVGPLPWER
ncbi:MAG TPA: FAD-dependent oxidoreductase [Pseudomonadales bacterium]